MKAIEFQSHIGDNLTFEIPPEIIAQLKKAPSFRVIVLIPESDVDNDWAQLAQEQFVKGYAPADSIYDQL